MMGSADVRERNVHIVRSVLENALADRLDEAEPFFADDFILNHAEGLPFGGVYRGWRGYTQVLQRLKEFWSTMKTESSVFIPYGDDKVIIHFTLNGHIAKNGRHVQMPVVAIWELRDSKIFRIRPFLFDTKRIADLAAT
jgi:ketosteroid isomerase-like protein